MHSNDILLTKINNYLQEGQNKPASREKAACLCDTSICRSFDPKDQLYQAMRGAFLLGEILNFDILKSYFYTRFVYNEGELIPFKSLRNLLKVCGSSDRQRIRNGQT